MTREEFKKTRFNCDTRFSYNGSIYPVIGINFVEGLLGLNMYEDPSDLSWVRCESGYVVNFPPGGKND